MTADLRSSIALRIKEERERKGLTQVLCAEKLNIARQTYLDLESGKTEPRVSILVDFSNLVDVSVHYLIFGENAVMNLEGDSEIMHAINKLIDMLCNESVETVNHLIEQMMLSLNHLKKVKQSTHS